MNKKFVPFSIVMVLSFAQTRAATNIFDDFRKSLQSMEEHFERVASRFDQNNFRLDSKESTIEFTIDVPEGIATDTIKLDISENRSFKIALGDENNWLTVGGATDGRFLSLSSRAETKNKEGKLNKQSNSSTHTFLGKLDIKNLQAEYDEETKQLIVSIPKLEDPNNKSVTIPLARRKK